MKKGIKKSFRSYLLASATLALAIPLASVLSCGSQNLDWTNASNKPGPVPSTEDWTDVTNTATPVIQDWTDLTPSTKTNAWINAATKATLVVVDKLQEKILHSLGGDEQSQLHNGLESIKKNKPVVVQKLTDQEYSYNEPSYAIFTGKNGQAKLETNFSILNPTIANNFLINYYKTPGNSSTPNVAIEITDLNKINLNNGDQFFVVVSPTSKDILINGQTHIVMQFTVSGLQDGSQPVDDPNYYVQDQTDPGIYERLSTQSASYDDIFKLMDQMQPGQVIGKGNYKLQMPTDISSKVNAPTAPLPGHIAAPFVDIAMAAMNDSPLDQKTLNAFNIYKYLSFGFIAGGVTSDGTQFGSWAGNPTITDQSQTNIIQIINQMRANGGDFIPSIGGANEGKAIWQGADPIILARWIELFALNYHLNRIDYDIEGGHQSDPSLPVYAAATAIAQKKLAQAGHPLELTLTLAAEWDGLHEGKKIMDTFVNSGVDFTMLNGMTMMMNQDKTKELGGLGGVTNSSVDHMKDQVKDSYSQAGVTLTDAQAYAKVGTTIDISSDTWASEFANISDFQKIYNSAMKNKIGQLGFWSVAGENFDINGMKMLLAELQKIATGLGVPIEGKDLVTLMNDVKSKLGGKLPTYGVYSQFDDVDKEQAPKTPIPNADQTILVNANQYALPSNNDTRKSAFDHVNFNYPTFDEAMAKYGSGIPQGTKIVSPGLGGQTHIFEAKFFATDRPWPVLPSRQWADLGVAIDSTDPTAIENPALIAETLSTTYQSLTPWYIRFKNADGSVNPKPTTASKFPVLDEINRIIVETNVNNVVEYNYIDLSRNHFFAKDLVFYLGKVYPIKWDTGNISPDDPYTKGNDPWNHDGAITLFNQ